MYINIYTHISTSICSAWIKKLLTQKKEKKSSFHFHIFSDYKNILIHNTWQKKQIFSFLKHLPRQYLTYFFLTKAIHQNCHENRNIVGPSKY